MARVENLYMPDCIRTVSGRYVNLVDPDPETFDIGDIAHALSRIPRFGGHLPVPYSVAQHSHHVSMLLLERTRSVQYQGLMHDASEAYLLDIPAPLKAHLPEYKAIKERMMERLAYHFGFEWPLGDAVKAADKAALELEWSELVLAGKRHVLLTPLGSDGTVKHLFLERYEELKPTRTR